MVQDRPPDDVNRAAHEIADEHLARHQERTVGDDRLAPQDTLGRHQVAVPVGVVGVVHLVDPGHRQRRR